MKMVKKWIVVVEVVKIKAKGRMMEERIVVMKVVKMRSRSGGRVRRRGG